MNLPRHLSVLWKFRAVALAGVLLGLVLAFLAAYDVTKLPGLERRGSELWSAESKILVTQVGFPEGRVTLPDQVPQNGVLVDPRADRNKLKFAAPERLSSLALLYSAIANGDEVRARLPGHPAPSQITSEAVDATGNHTQFLPVIKLTTQAGSSPGAAALNTQAFAALKQLLESQQKRAHISADERIRLGLLNRPSLPVRLSGPSLTPSILAFLLCCLAALAVVHVLEALSFRRTSAGQALVRVPTDFYGNRPGTLAPLRPDVDGAHTQADVSTRALWGTHRRAE